MRQKQTRAAKRADAEDRHGLDVAAWAQGEESCDCHPLVWMERYLKLDYTL